MRRLAGDRRWPLAAIAAAIALLGGSIGAGQLDGTLRRDLRRRPRPGRRPAGEDRRRPGGDDRERRRSRPTSRPGSRRTVDSRFMPFHQDATCTIRPEGLIAENYVECDPGTRQQPAAAAPRADSRRPSRSRTRPSRSACSTCSTSSTCPTRERLTVILNELGIATAGRGPGLQRHPAPRQPDAGAGATGDRDPRPPAARSSAAIVDATNTIAANGAAAHGATLQTFLDRAAALTTLDRRAPRARCRRRSSGCRRCSPRPSRRSRSSTRSPSTARRCVQQLHAAAPVAEPGLRRPRSVRDGGQARRWPSSRAALDKAIPAIRDSRPR